MTVESRVSTRRTGLGAGPVAVRLTRPGPVTASIPTSTRLHFRMGRLGSSSAPAATGTHPGGAQRYARAYRPNAQNLGAILRSAEPATTLTMTPGARTAYVQDAAGRYGPLSRDQASVKVLISRVQVAAPRAKFLVAVAEGATS